MSTVSFHYWGDQAAGVREVARVLGPECHLLLVDASLTESRYKCNHAHEDAFKRARNLNQLTG